MPAWVDAGVNEYLKRFPADCKVSVTEISPGRRGKNADIPRILTQEGAAMLSAVDKRHRIIALEVGGQSWDTPALAKQLQQWRMSGDDVSLLVGGPEGLAAECVAAASQRWSLSPLTLPHPIVRVLLAESLYRAWSIINNHPYHRE